LLKEQMPPVAYRLAVCRQVKLCWRGGAQSRS
jgi:hypothetical protein